MEILSNFASIYCFIAFILGAVFMLIMLTIAAMGKVKESRNKVRFYIRKTTKGNILSLKNKIGLLIISIDIEFEDFGLDPDDFADMKEGELREVYLDLED